MAGVSVAAVIPTYNRPQHTVRAVASVAMQTRPPDEILIVDDGSTDNTAAAVRCEFPEVEVIESQRQGVSAARNLGVKESSSDWIAFLDSDDEWKPAKLERQLAAVADSKYRIAHCDEEWIRHGRRVNPRRRHRKQGGYIYRHCLPLCCISPSAVIVERSLLEEMGGFDETLPACEDYDLWLRICARFPVCFLDEKLVVKYGGHDDQLSRSVPALDRYRVRALEQAYRVPGISRADRLATLETMVGKLRILLQGAEKRSHSRASSYREKLKHYQFLLDHEVGRSESI